MPNNGKNKKWETSVFEEKSFTLGVSFLPDKVAALAVQTVGIELPTVESVEKLDTASASAEAKLTATAKVQCTPTASFPRLPTPHPRSSTATGTVPA
eukprot:4128974-Amphidinium_carterae.1